MKDLTSGLPPDLAAGVSVPTARDIVTIATGACPVIDTIIVDNSTDVHIGPKIVSVVQNIDNSEKVKGRFLCLQLVSKLNKSGRLRCSVAVFLCWIILVCSGLAVYLIYVLLSVRPTRVDIGINATWYIRRAEWQAIEVFSFSFLNLPASNVVIGHSGYENCSERFQCGHRVLVLQQMHIFQGLRDIVPNFLVGGNGYVLEGRGANIQGAMIDGWNYRSISILFLGDYWKDEVDSAQMDNLKEVLDRLVELDVLVADYDLYGLCQLINSTSPGPNLFKRLEELPNWSQHNAANCVTNYKDNVI